QRLETESFGSPCLVALRAELDTQGWPASRRIARLSLLMDLLDSRRNALFQPVAAFLLWDIHLSYAFEDWRRTSGPYLRRWLNAVGEMEALSSLAAYSYEHPQDVFPELATESPCFEGEGVGHPLLAEDRVVRNDVSLAGDRRVLVVSSSNMS